MLFFVNWTRMNAVTKIILSFSSARSFWWWFLLVRGGEKTCTRWSHVRPGICCGLRCHRNACPLVGAGRARRYSFIWLGSEAMGKAGETQTAHPTSRTPWQNHGLGDCRKLSNDPCYCGSPYFCTAPTGVSGRVVKAGNIGPRSSDLLRECFNSWVIWIAFPPCRPLKHDISQSKHLLRAKPALQGFWTIISIINITLIVAFSVPFSKARDTKVIGLF